ncbi:MAG: rRNA cytosine-C5-methyltransferase [Muribaculaceae bacterium]|nr:rRNA cytosine-C5-methyltransferase [Muribaculaceae bacterium]
MNLNEHFIQQINNLLPVDEASAMLHAIENDEPVISVRFNDSKGFIPPARLERVPWCEMGAYLSERPQFTFDPHWHAGSYYVQDASSMFIYHVIKSLVVKPVKYLDLCAAPGGKTTAALQALPQGSVVVANEIVPPRAQVLRENIIKCGHNNCMVTNDSPRALGKLENAFDIIAADVPCSGEGMFRKDEEAVSQWSPQLVAQCVARQREILNDIWPALKPGGLLIYSTCTYNLDENEKMALYIANELGASFVEVPVEEDWNVTGDLSGNNIPCYRFLPHRTRGEGLFLCVLRKMHSAQLTNEARAESKLACPMPCKEEKRDSEHIMHIAQCKPSKQKRKNTSSKIPKDASSWLDGDYELSDNNGTIIATNKDLKELISVSGNNLHIIKDLNIEIGTMKGNKIIPSHQLAMSPQLRDDAFEKCEVDYHTAIAYLRGEAIIINAPRGYVLITYQNAILGFVNNLGNRANNLYPKSWRILSSHIPENAPSFF